MKNSFKEILKQLDWSDGFRIPIANDENKQLEKEVIHLFILLNFIVKYLLLRSSLF